MMSMYVCMRGQSLFELSEDYEVKVRINQGSVFIIYFSVVICVSTELKRKNMLSELLHDNDLVLMAETTCGPTHKIEGF